MFHYSHLEQPEAKIRAAFEQFRRLDQAEED